ncbi:hypothetical protein RR46_01848 [Papilio xuthus]|uniref:C2H2-type domain-containing protein n=1 Tax=Papilio xuthus TaxID=66420 RepID=A0A194QKB2_PAPXU|nr:hypothetical protein RR46_01848 [Papilio xuthus]
MAEDDGEIEFLDEDADIVQQCVHTDEDPPPLEAPIPFLVERSPVEKPRKKRKTEEDSDYEPSKDASSKPKKRKTPKIPRSSIKSQKYEYFAQSAPIKYKVKEYGPKKMKKLQMKRENIPRTQLDIRIPDYDDPLCMPVRAVKKDGSDTTKLKIWNNLCLEHFKKSDTVLRPDSGETVSSKRTVLLKNVFNKFTGRQETSMWTKTMATNNNGVSKSDVVQSVLPKFREKKVLNYKLIDTKRRKSYRHVDEVIITKEVQKDGEQLIVYKPRETISLVYKMFEKPENSEGGKEEDEEQKKYMKEVASCRVCAPCFQLSWRGSRKEDKKIRCEICSTVCANVQRLLAHLKSHSAHDVNKYKRLVSRALAKVVGYQYTCRICQHQFPAITELRRHLLKHTGTETFICEVGGHLAT